MPRAAATTSDRNTRKQRTSPSYRLFIGLIALVCIGQLWVWSGSVSFERPTAQDGEQDHSNDRNALRYQPREDPVSNALPASTWTCTLEGQTSKGAERSRQCVVEHVCVDDEGLFLLSQDGHGQSAEHFPAINLVSSRESGDYYWKPRSKAVAGVSTEMYFKQETVFVYGLFQPGHFSHFLYGGMLPLYSTMKRFKGTGSSWLLRHAEYVGENLKNQAVWEMDAILPSGKELVLNSFEVMSSFQVLPPKRAPICFKRAVIGLGSQCGFSYCVTNTPTEIYRAYSQQIQNYYWPTAQRWNEFLRERAVEEKENQAKYNTSKLKFSPTKCLQSARYYNFEEGKVDFPQYAEPKARQGEKDLDSIDQPITAYRNQSYQASQDWRPIVAIVERHGTRAVLNIDQVIFAVVNSGDFRLKVISYDSGCGIPETAYLMRDVNILISTHGNALGGSLWMPSPPFHPRPVVISIDSTRYYENWFQWTTTAMAQRFIIHRCGPAISYNGKSAEINEVVCPLHRDLHLARTSLRKVGLVLDSDTEAEDLLQLTEAEYPLGLFDRFSADQELSASTSKGEGGFEAADKYGTTKVEKMNLFLSDYWKNLARYADPLRLLRFLEDIRDENAQQAEASKSYLQICKEGRCCGPECVSVMNRNVAGKLRACDQDLSEGLWGEHRWNKEQDEFTRSGQSFETWSQK